MDAFTFDEVKILDKINAEAGAGSVVTQREYEEDDCVTITKHEKEVLFKIHTRFPRGSVEEANARGEQTSFPFKLYPDGQVIDLKITHPKAKGNELRLYFDKTKFKPYFGLNWVLFLRSGELWIGALSDEEILLLQSGHVPDAHDGFLTEGETEYQTEVNALIPPRKQIALVSGYARDASLARQVLMESGYQCEMMPDHECFISKATAKPYLEAHHFVPMFHQRHLPNINLDVKENICVLNPYAHKMVHHARYSDIEDHIRKMAEPREGFLNSIGLDVNEVLRMYGGPR